MRVKNVRRDPVGALVYRVGFTHLARRSDRSKHHDVYVIAVPLEREYWRSI